MGDAEFIPSLLTMATVFWLVLVCACGLMATANGEPSDSAAGYVTSDVHDHLSQPTIRQVIGAFVGYATLLYVAFVVTVIAKWSPT